MKGQLELGGDGSVHLTSNTTEASGAVELRRDVLILSGLSTSLELMLTGEAGVSSSLSVQSGGSAQVSGSSGFSVALFGSIDTEAGTAHFTACRNMRTETACQTPCVTLLALVLLAPTLAL